MITNIFQMVKYLIMACITCSSFLLFASTPVSGLFQNDLVLYNKLFLNYQNFDNNFNDRTFEPFQQISKDPLNRIDDYFSVTNYFTPFVSFWFLVYSQFNSNQFLIHDKENLGIVYDVLNLSNIDSSEINDVTKSAVIKDIVKNQTEQIKNELIRIADDENNTDFLFYKRLMESFSRAQIAVPINAADRKAFFITLSQNIRSQTGQKNFVNEGLKNISIYYPTIMILFKSFNVPEELIAIPMIESSFNTSAISRAGAVGPWQFTQKTGKHFLKIDKFRDDRINPIISTVAALFLLKQNKSILKSWDLAISAYNSGTKHISIAKKSVPPTADHPLEAILTDYSHPHLGFASKNYFAEFLAMSYVMSYKDRLFNKEGIFTKNKIFKLLIAKKPFNANEFFKKYSSSKNQLADLNKHLRVLNYAYPKGTPIVSLEQVPASDFCEVNLDRINNVMPKNFERILSNPNCK